MNVLVMGLPGAGKTWLASRIADHFKIPLFDGDAMRDLFGNWDFSIQGRETQMKTIRCLGKITDNCVASVVCPTVELRTILGFHCIIWLNTIERSVYNDTNEIFVTPTHKECTHFVQLDKHPTKHQLWLAMSKCHEEYTSINLMNMIKQIRSDSLTW